MPGSVPGSLFITAVHPGRRKLEGFNCKAAESLATKFSGAALEPHHQLDILFDPLSESQKTCDEP
jgi:hypothetical protein